ncbi:hypothetical protein J7I44_04915 [Frateuria sp. MAH-13]|uniref:Uncharacterized protein n=1 Tax=Frateuria flava TaxID=2821489 RepID=A0ABS4DKP9_9GAMM|nr:hypothetical protein [Frateuria flava]MBP1473629.1 hypothetical protein [Frateuria flava]
MAIISTNNRSWYAAYSVLASYLMLCVLFVFVAPTSYEPSLPFSRSLAALSSIPSVVAFNVDAMWATFLPALFAFSKVAPVKLKANANQSDIPAAVLGFVLFSCIAMALIGYGTLAKVDATSTTKAAAMAAWAARSKIGLVCVSAFYFSSSLCMAWIGFVACPRSYQMLLSDRSNISSKRTR